MISKEIERREKKQTTMWSEFYPEMKSEVEEESDPSI
jgi:hypothetical protein